MKKVKEKKKKTTKQVYNKWRAAKWGLKAGTYTAPLIPEAVILGVNWNEWLAESNSWSLGAGFSSLLVTIVLTIWGIAKKDELMKKTVSPLFYLSIVMVMWAIVLMFLSSIASSFGTMLFYSAAGICAGACCDQVNKSKVIPECEWYKQMMKEVGLDKAENKRKERREKARQEALKEKAEEDGTSI